MPEINIYAYPLGEDSKIICSHIASEINDIKWCFSYSDNINKELLNCDLLILIANLNYPSELRQVIWIMRAAEQSAIPIVVCTITPILLLRWGKMSYHRSPAYKDDREIGTLESYFHQVLSKTAVIQLESGLSYSYCEDYDVHDFYKNIKHVSTLFRDKKSIKKTPQKFDIKSIKVDQKNIARTPLVRHYSAKGFKPICIDFLLKIKAIVGPITRQELIGVDFADYDLAFANKGLYQTVIYTQEALSNARVNNGYWFKANVIIATIFLNSESALDRFSTISKLISNMLKVSEALLLIAPVIDECAQDEPIISIIYKL